MSAAVRVTLLLVLGLVVLGRGLLYLDDRLASAGRPAPAPAPAPRAAATPAGASTPSAAATPAPVAPPAPPPPPTESQLLALRLGNSAARADALRDLRGARGDAGAPRGARRGHAPGRHPGTRPKSFAWSRAIAPAPTRRRSTSAFAALPAEPRDVDWHHEGAACLVEVIAARAAEDPARRCCPRRARRLRSDAPRCARGSRGSTWRRCRSDRGGRGRTGARRPPTPSPRRRSGDRDGRRAEVARPRRRLGGGIRRLISGDRGARARGADRRGVAGHRRARDRVASGDGLPEGARGSGALKPGTLDLRLASVAADPRHPVFARGNAALLVAGQGGEEACRRLARIDVTDAAIGPT